MKSFEDIIRIIAQKYPALRKRLQESSSVVRWEESVGKSIALHAKALWVKDSILWVEVDHPIWKAELHQRKSQILKRLNELNDNASPIKDLILVSPRKKIPTA